MLQFQIVLTMIMPKTLLYQVCGILATCSSSLNLKKRKDFEVEAVRSMHDTFYPLSPIAIDVLDDEFSLSAGIVLEAQRSILTLDKDRENTLAFKKYMATPWFPAHLPLCWYAKTIACS